MSVEQDDPAVRVTSSGNKTGRVTCQMRGTCYVSPMLTENVAAEGEEEPGRLDKVNHECTVNHILILQLQSACATAAGDICILLRQLAVAL